MDKGRMSKILKSQAHERATRPLGDTSREPSKEELRKMAQEALKSGTKITKLPPAEIKREKRY